MAKKERKGRFLIIVCPRCSNRQIIFGKATLKIKCLKCNKLLIKPTGGKTKIKARIERIL